MMALGFCSPAVLAGFITILLTGLLAEQVDTTVEPIPDTHPKQHVRVSHGSLSAGETDYILQRKEVVLESLGRLHINCTATSVPHVALLGSGGGQRAAVALLGSLHQMEQDHLLDTLLYLGGVSGSTWAMTTLYSDPQWSINMEPVLSTLSGPRLKLQDSLKWLQDRASEENFSLSDIQGVISALFMNHSPSSVFGVIKLDLRHLSEEASHNSTNPYPVYSAIEKQCYSSGPLEAQWFEFTPHEAGFTELGLFVPTADLGSRFQGGGLKEKKPEMDMVQLQGVLGSALADEDSLNHLLPVWMNMTAADHVSQGYLRGYFMLAALVELLKSYSEEPNLQSQLDELQRGIEDKLQKEFHRDLMTTEDQINVLRQRNLEMTASVQTWCQNLPDGSFKAVSTWMTQRLFPLVIKWEWGTTQNFLYQFEGSDSKVPPCLQTEVVHLMDAGLLVNVPYPSFLGEKRDIDLIIAPEYSAGEMFETLTLARDYAAKLRLPFPVIDDKVLEDKDWPKDYYVFPGEHNQPTIIFMPLFNRKNCKDEAEVQERRMQYSTFSLPLSQEEIVALLDIARTNMRNNKDAIVREIHNAAVRRQSRRNTADPAL